MYNLISNLHDFVHVMETSMSKYKRKDRILQSIDQYKRANNDSRIISLQNTRLAIT